MKNQLFSKFLSALLIVMLALVALPVTPARAATLTVTTNADVVAVNGQCSLREAIVNANNDAATNSDCVAGTGNDTIVFSAAVTTITLTSALPNINDAAGANDLTIDGGSTVTINANAVARVFNVTAGTFTVQNITLSNGQVNGNGGGILYAGGEGLVVSSVTFNTNRTVMGGGNDGGAIYHTAGTLSILNSTFSGNYTQDTGGAIHIQAGTGTMTISGSTFSNQNNVAINDGGAIYLNNGTLQINGTTFSDNAATGPGGGASGGAIYQNNGTLTIGNTTATSFTSNSATNDGGAIYVAGGTLTVSSTTFTSNTADQGGAIDHNSNTAFTISDSTFTTNSATAGDGGAIRTNSGGGAASLSITNSTFTGNTSTDDGGALVIVSEPATITGSIFQNNSITSSAGNAAEGGAIRNEGAADQTTIRMTSFIGNSITHTGNQNVSGGAIANDGDNFILANVTFSGNSVNKTAAGAGNARGGAVWINGSATIHNVTFSGNSASESGTGTADGGNLYREGGTVTVRNTILNNGTQNGSADNCGGTLGAAALNSNFADNISFSATDCGAAVTNSNPLLGSLTGSPAYFPIGATSPARNNGINAICATTTTTNNQSQNGLTRPQDTNCEIGSYEFPPNTPPTGTDNTITINEDTPHTFAAADFGFNDVDAGDTMSAVRIDTLLIPPGSTLQLSAVNVIAGQVILTANIPNLVFTPAADENGTGFASFTFSVRDTNGPAFDTIPNAMTFNVTAVNDAPSFTASNPPAVNEDSGIQVVLWATPDFGPPDEDSSQAVVQYIISNSTCGTLLSAGPSVNPSGQLTYTPAADQNGTCTFDVQVQDNGGTANGGVDTSLAQNFTITVNAVNDVPSFTASNPPAVNEDAGAQTVNSWATFNPGPANESGQAVSQYTISNSTCGTLLSAGPAVSTGGTLTYTPAADQNGTCTFDVQVQDNGGTANGGVDTSPAQNFTITVNAVNDAPSFSASNPPAVNEDAGAQNVAGWATFSAGPADESSQTVVGYTVSNSTCGSLLTADPVVNNAGDLSYTPVADQNGTCTFDVVVEDNGGTANGGVNTSAPQNFTITINAVNDEPSFTASNPPAVNEDAGAQTVNSWATFNPGPANESGQAVLQYIVSNSTCGTLLSAGPAVSTAGALTYTPAADQNGTCTFDVQVQDNGGTANGGDDTSPTQNFTITVNAVDDASIANNDVATVWEDSSANTINVRSNDTDIDSAVELIQSVTQPANGTVVITNAGADLTYQPNADYCNDGTPTDDFTYTLTGGDSATVQVTVTCQTVITANITASDKTYDGNTSASFTCSLTGVVPPDVVSCTGGTATFADKNVGTGKLVTATGLGITGADAFKYELASTSATDNADITERTLNVTATGINKVYDGNTNATVTLNDDRVGGDDLTLSYTSASFADPNVGAAKPVSVSGISISGGADAGNYVLGNTTTSTNADITPASQTITVTTSAPASAVNSTSFNVAATASSGLPVTITTSGSCTGGDTDGDATITMTSGTGTCSVFYDQAGNSNYNAAPQVQEDVTATDSPVFTSANNTTFDFGFSDTFAITATGNPSTMSITMSGEPAGVTITDNGDGTATLNYDGTTTPGVYTITFTADNGVLPNGTQTFTLTIRNGPTVSIVNSLPDTGNGSVSENESISTNLNLTQLIVEFDRDVYDPSGDTDPDDVTNPANYLLVRSTSGTFATTTCDGGVTAPDVAISVDSVTYSNGGGSGPFVATLNINSGLPLNVAGFYRLFVCGTTSIADASNPLLILAGNGVNPGTDFTRNFRIAAPVIGGGGGGGANASTTTPTLTGALIPVTGFAPSQVTELPAQPVEKAYATSELTLKIPSLGVNLPIVGVEFDENGWDVTWLGNNAGYLEGSAYPTWNGNSILTSHVTDPNGKPGPFAYVNELKEGDKVYVHNDGYIYVYEVRKNQLILPTSIKTLFKSEEDAWLTLVTCENFNEKTNRFSHRRMIRAVLISIILEK